jgi:hypothetical protein
MTEFLPPSDLFDLIERVRDGAESEAEHAELERQLRDDPAARRQYVRYLLMCSELRGLSNRDGEEMVSTPRLDMARALDAREERFPDSRRSAWRRLASRWSIGVAAAIAFAIAAWSWHSLWNRAGHGHANQRAQVVATLGASMDAEWEGGKILVPGSAIPAGPLQLKRGLAEVEYPHGATVILQAPVRCVFESSYRLKLQSGRISALVPSEGIGFTVQTPEAMLVDLGTEFGVNSEREGATDVHVFRGQVALGDRLDKSKGSRLLNQGTAKRVEAGRGEPQDIPANDLAFVRQQEFEARIKAKQNSPYHRWLTYSYGLRREPALVLYYTFDNQADQPERVLNRAGATAGKLDGALDATNLAARWVSEGRCPEQRALRFAADNPSWVRVPHSNELNITQALTLAAWVRPATALLGDTAVILSKSARDSGSSPNFELGLRRHEDSRGNTLCSVYLQCGSRLVESEGVLVAPGKWTFVAATSSRDATVVYVNGKPAVKGDGGELVPNNGDLLVGASVSHSLAQNASPTQPFEGLISELVLVRRAMTADEIMEMYMAGRQEQ